MKSNYITYQWALKDKKRNNFITVGEISYQDDDFRNLPMIYSTRKEAREDKDCAFPDEEVQVVKVEITIEEVA